MLFLAVAGMGFGATPPKPAPMPEQKAGFRSLPLRFEANQGQTDPTVKFLSRGNGYALFLTADSAVFRLGSPREDSAHAALSSSIVRMKLAGASPNARVSGAGPLPGKINYFIGNDPKKWTSGASTYAKVNYQQVYKGIDLVYYGAEGQLEYDFVVAPGADSRQIALEFAGAQPRLAPDGALLLALDGAPLSFRRPIVYQTIAGKRKTIRGGYRLTANRVQFSLGEYDHTRALVIDPVMSYFTYLGGSANDYVGNPPGYLQFAVSPSQSIAADPAGNLYVTGFTNSTDFPVQSAFQSQNISAPANGAPYVAFVTKLDPTGSHLVYSTYLGGATAGQTKGYAIAIDSSGSAYVTGSTQQADFPVTAGAYQKICGWVNNGQSTCGGSASSAFLTKLSPSGGSLAYSTFFGPGTLDAGYSVAVDSQGQAYLAGISTASCASNDPTACFPTTASAVLPGSMFNGTLQQGKTFNQGSAFISVFDAAGANLLYSSLYGGLGSTAAGSDGKPGNNGATYGAGVAVDASGNFYLAGTSSSNQLPVTTGAYQRYFSGPNGNLGRGYVAKFSPVGSKGGASLIYSTFVGGTDGVNDGSDQIGGIAVDATGNAYVTGNTQSYDFPVTINNPTSCTAKNGCQNTGFLAKINPAGNGLVWSTLVGASTNCCSGVLAIMAPPRLDPSGNLIVTGRLNGSIGFPFVNPLQPQTNGFGGVFVTKYDPTASKILFSTNIYSPSTNGGMFPGGADVDAQGNIYVAGFAALTDLPVTTGAFRTTNAGATDVFIAKINPSTPSPTITEVDNAFSNIANSPIQSGAWVAIKGTNLSNTTPGRGWNANESFPTSMDGTSVTINGKPAFLYFISPNQVNVQAPTDSAVGQVSVVVTNNSVPSSPATATYQTNAPALLQWGGGQYPYALITNGATYIGKSSVVPGTVSAHAGDSLTLWATGLGATTPPLSAGQQPATFPPVTTTPSVTVGGTSVTVQGAVLRYAGLYQVNIQLPGSLSAGDLPIKIIQGSFQSPDGILINVQP